MDGKPEPDDTLTAVQPPVAEPMPDQQQQLDQQADGTTETPIDVAESQPVEQQQAATLDANTETTTDAKSVEQTPEADTTDSTTPDTVADVPPSTEPSPAATPGPAASQRDDTGYTADDVRVFMDIFRHLWQGTPITIEAGQENRDTKPVCQAV